MGLQVGNWDWGRGVWSAVCFHYVSRLSAVLLFSIFYYFPHVAYIALRIVTQLNKHREIGGRFHDPGVEVACITFVRFHDLEFTSMATFNCATGLRNVGPGRRNTGLGMGLKVSAITSLEISFVFQKFYFSVYFYSLSVIHWMLVISSLTFLKQ